MGDDHAVISVGDKLTEGALWERVVSRRDGMGFHWAAGPLAGYDRRPGVVVVPDVALMSLPAARAAVTMIGADVVHLERSGKSVAWRPEDRWIAGLHRRDAGCASPHLLDRFGIRVDAADLRPRPDGRPLLDPPDSAWAHAIRAHRLPSFTPEAAERVVTAFPSGSPGLRRELALGRLARALAALNGARDVHAGHVDAAAELIGLIEAPAREADQEVAVPVLDIPDRQLNTGSPALASADEEREVIVGIGPELIEAEPFQDTALPHAMDPFPEDDAEPWRDSDALRITWQRAISGPPRGHPIGSHATREPRDIAVTATLLQAAKFQAVRCPSGPSAHYSDDHALHMSAADLRSYRRAPEPRYLLVLVLDHTCRTPDWNWYQPLAPYLQWAYAVRAPVGIVEVGSAAAAEELRAEQFRCRSLLDPRVANALERRPGRATPLAHGLSLAAGILRHDTQQGVATVSEAVLVVVTDGRGNVPLSASYFAELPPQVGQDGVRDAIDAARLISGLHRVRSVVIDPGSRAYGHLTSMLAEVLNGLLVHGGADRSGEA